MKTKVANCGSCQFRRDNLCCRFPPVAIIESNKYASFDFPIVSDDWWCGEWKFGSHLASEQENKNV